MLSRTVICATFFAILSPTLHHWTQPTPGQDETLSEKLTRAQNESHVLSSVRPVPATNSSVTVSEDMRVTASKSGPQFLEHVNLSMHDVWVCYNSALEADSDKHIHLRVLSGSLILDNFPHNSSERIRCPSVFDWCDCRFNLRAPDRHVFHLKVTKVEGGCSDRLHITIWHLSADMALFSVCGWYSDAVFSVSNDVSVHVDVRNPPPFFRFHLQFTAVLQSSGQLESHFISPWSGYIQTPLWDGTSVSLSSYIDSQIQIDLPDQHKVMLSFLDFDIPVRKLFSWASCHVAIVLKNASSNESVNISDNQHSRQKLTWHGKLYFRPQLHSAHQLHIEIMCENEKTYDAKAMYRGLCLLFTFHNVSNLPSQSPDGLWNCSVPYWPTFRRHVLCNLDTECSDGQDEQECSYTTELCEEGQFYVDGLCYSYVQKLPEKQSMDWNTAKAFCMFRGGRLANVKTMTTLRQLRHLLRPVLNRIHPLYIGVETFLQDHLSSVNQFTGRHSDGTMAYYLAQFLTFTTQRACWGLTPGGFKDVGCLDPNKSILGHSLCEFDPKVSASKNGTQSTIFPTSNRFPNPPSDWPHNVLNTSCPEGHLTLDFLLCDLLSSCWRQSVGVGASCDVPLRFPPPVFMCNNGMQDVSYALVCNHYQDCIDDSDENFCTFPVCGLNLFDCGNGQCLNRRYICDHIKQCSSGWDESFCAGRRLGIAMQRHETPALVNFELYGLFVLPSFTCLEPSALFPGSLCPGTHFQCLGNSYCLPVFLRCNGVYDCPSWDDEALCVSHTCTGFYQCRNSKVCLRPEHLCDDIVQCPSREDEFFCDLTCPPECTCYGWSFFCTQVFNVTSHRDLRYLDVRGTGMVPHHFRNMTSLVYLSVAQCGLTSVQIPDLLNLHGIDLSDNLLSSVEILSLQTFAHLHFLSLAGNPLVKFLTRESNISALRSMCSLDLSRVPLKELHSDMLTFFPRLHVLNLSFTGLQRVSGSGFQTLAKLRVLDTRGCPLTDFPASIFHGITHLQVVYSDNFKLCCPATLPKGFNPQDCYSPVNEISSCEDLLRSVIYRVFLSLFATLALCGNVLSVCIRFFKQNTKLGFDVFVSSLCVSDFLMGVYLAAVGVADRVYQGEYLWQDNTWRHSLPCQLAGFLCLLASENSALIICLITLDRFLVLKFPFSRFHFTRGTALLACCTVCTVSVVLAAIPLLPVFSYWQFYSQTSICIPLPVTRLTFLGHDYSFSIMIIFNFILFLLIAAGQLAIFYSVQAAKLGIGETSQTSKDLTIARRLITIAISDFLCWFPIGLLAMMASQGVPVSGEVNVALAIFVLPINSAINPFLYTLNMALETNRRQHEQRLLKYLSSQLKSTASKQ